MSLPSTCSHRLALRLVTIPIHTIWVVKKKKKNYFENGSRIVVLRDKWHNHNFLLEEAICIPELK